MDQDDADLLSLLATDLDRDFRQLVLYYQQRLYSFALRLAGSPHDAEDIVQEAFLRAYHALKSYPVLKVRALRLRPWLYAITLNIFRDRKRKPEHLSISLDTSEDSPMLEIKDQSLGPDEEAYWHEWRDELERHVATLPERYRVGRSRFIILKTSVMLRWPNCSINPWEQSKRTYIVLYVRYIRYWKHKRME
jgi:RNA polymerase sigma-70 factor (ECF subfamily)